MSSTYANLRGSIPGYGSSSAPVADVMAAGMPAVPAPAPINVAAGNIFGGGIPTAERNAIAGASPAEQLAGFLAGTEDQGRVSQFQSALQRSGFNLNPVGQFPEDYRGAIAGAKNLYNNIFRSPATPEFTGVPSPQSFFAPTGLRERALDAQGAPVIGAGGAIVTASPAAMTGDDGRALPLNQQRGASFTLRQNPFTTAAMTTPAATTQSVPSTQQSSPYDQNVSAFKNHLVAQQMQAGLMKSIPPGYMLDPNKPGAIMAIPGGPAEAEQNAAKVAASEKTRQTIANATNVLGTIDRVLPKISEKTTGWGSLLSSIPGSEAKNVEGDIKAINAALGIDTLMEIRNAAKNGASGFGSLTEKEFENIVASKANLDRAQSPGQIRENISKIRTSYDRLLKMANGINPDLPVGGATAPSGVDPAIWNVMTPEEKSLWK